MSETDRFRTLADGPWIERRIRGSRFLAAAFPASDRAAAAVRVDRVRREHPTASHHVWAFRSAPPSESRSWSDDDGEPSGTAGAPVLARIEGRRLFGAGVVVVRYFGGTKLGKGGLIRAYGEAAAAALEAAPERTVVETLAITVRCAFEDLGALEAYLGRARSAEDVVDARRAYDRGVVFRLRVRRSRREAVRDALLDALSGRLTIEEDSRPCRRENWSGRPDLN